VLESLAEHAAQSRGLRLCKAKKGHAICGSEDWHMAGSWCLCVGADVEDGLFGREAREPFWRRSRRRLSSRLYRRRSGETLR
jgi:hypothetical protein